MAKELLYKEIVENQEFVWKDSGKNTYTDDFKRKKEFDEYIENDKGHWVDFKVVMEFPYYHGKWKEWGHVCTPYSFENQYEPWLLCAKSILSNGNTHCSKSIIKKDGYCGCHECEYFIYKKGMKVFDIAIISIFDDGYYEIECVIEVVNKHFPQWLGEPLGIIENVYIIKANDILKRISNTPVYVTSKMCMKEQWIKMCCNKYL